MPPQRRSGRRSLRRRASAARLVSWLLTGVLMLSAAVGVRAEPLTATQSLRQVLQGSIGDGSPGSRDLDARRRDLQERMTAITALPDLREALLLPDWRDGDSEEAIAAVDREARGQLIEHFQQSVRHILQDGDPASKLATLCMIADMNARVHGKAIAGWSFSAFAPDLAALVRAEQEAMVRATAAHVLGQISADPAICIAALDELSQSPDVQLRRAAVASLDEVLMLVPSGPGQGSVPRPEARAEIVRIGQATVAVVGRTLTDTDAEVRRRSVDALVQSAIVLDRLIGEPRTVDVQDPEAIAVYRQEVDGERAELAPLVHDLHEQTSGLNKALNDPAPEVRLLARRALEEWGTVWQRLEARAASLTSIAQASHVPSTPGTSESEPQTTPPGDAEHPRASEPILERLRASLPNLAEGLKDRNVGARRASLDALEILGDEAAPAAPQIIAVLTDPDPFVRWAAARILGKLKHVDARAVVSALVPLLRDRDLDVRLAATEAIGRQGPAAQDAIPSLSRAVRAGDPVMRLAAIQALQMMDSAAEPAIPALAEALSDPDPRVRQSAAQLLGKFGPLAAPFHGVLRLMINDADPGVRKAVGDALLLIGPPKTPGAAPETPATGTEAAEESHSLLTASWEEAPAEPEAAPAVKPATAEIDVPPAQGAPAEKAEATPVELPSPTPPAAAPAAPPPAPAPTPTPPPAKDEGFESAVDTTGAAPAAPSPGPATSSKDAATAMPLPPSAPPPAPLPPSSAAPTAKNPADNVSPPAPEPPQPTPPRSSETTPAPSKPVEDPAPKPESPSVAPATEPPSAPAAGAPASNPPPLTPAPVPTPLPPAVPPPAAAPATASPPSSAMPPSPLSGMPTDEAGQASTSSRSISVMVPSSGLTSPVPAFQGPVPAGQIIAATPGAGAIPRREVVRRSVPGSTSTWTAPPTLAPNPYALPRPGEVIATSSGWSGSTTLRGWSQPSVSTSPTVANRPPDR